MKTHEDKVIQEAKEALRMKRIPIAILKRLIKRLLRVIQRLLEALLERRKPAKFDWIVGLAQQKERKTSMLELTITNEQKIPVRMAPVTSTGKPAAIDPNNKPTWEVVTGNSTVGAISEDGKTAELVSSDDPGDTQFMVKADADVGEGVEEISDIIKLTVAGAKAESLGLSAGAPVPKDTATPTPQAKKK